MCALIEKVYFIPWIIIRIDIDIQKVKKPLIALFLLFLKLFEENLRICFFQHFIIYANLNAKHFTNKNSFKTTQDDAIKKDDPFSIIQMFI